MISLIGGLLTTVFGGIKDHLEGKRKLKQAEVNNRARLLEDSQSNNHDWEMANLADKDKWMRRISFIMFTWPFLWIYFDPEAAEAYFLILDEQLPEWYKQTYMAMTGGIWGISALKNTLPTVVGGVVNAIRGK